MWHHVVGRMIESYKWMWSSIPKMETAVYPKTLEHIYWTIWCHIFMLTIAITPQISHFSVRFSINSTTSLFTSKHNCHRCLFPTVHLASSCQHACSLSFWQPLWGMARNPKHWRTLSLNIYSCTFICLAQFQVSEKRYLLFSPEQISKIHNFWRNLQCRMTLTSDWESWTWGKIQINYVNFKVT
jgi:hypothetical protein